MMTNPCAVSHIRVAITTGGEGENCLRSGASLTEGEEASEMLLVCGKQSCTFLHRGHATCLRQWEMCAVKRLQQLISATTAVTLSIANPIDLAYFSSSLVNFRLLFTCPKCNQSPLCMARVSPKGILEKMHFGSVLKEAPALFQLIQRAELGHMKQANALSACLSDLELASSISKLFANSFSTTSTATSCTTDSHLYSKEAGIRGERPGSLRFSDTCLPSEAVTSIAGARPPYSAGQFGPTRDRNENLFFPQLQNPAPQQQLPRCNYSLRQQFQQRVPLKYHRQMSLSGAGSETSSGFVSDFSSCNSSHRGSKPGPLLASRESLENATSVGDDAGNMDPRNLSAESFWRSSNFFSTPINPKPPTQIKKEGEEMRPRSGSMAVRGVQRDEQQSNRRVDPTTGQKMRSLSINVDSLYQAVNRQRNSQQHQHNAQGNIFRQRKDFSAFHILHPSKMNGYFIQLEDDSCTGNEDTRSFLLCQLTNHGASELYCLACGVAMPVYDHFPVVDGALFLSPLCHRGGLQVVWNSPTAPVNVDQNASPGQLFGPPAPPPGCTGPRQQQSLPGGNYRQRQKSKVCQERYLHAICMSCMRSTTTNDGSSDSSDATQIICRFCSSPWKGSTLLIGGMYTYDLFASTPCCAEHLKCKACGQLVISSLPATPTTVNTNTTSTNGVQSTSTTTQGTPKRVESFSGILEVSLSNPGRQASLRRLSEGAQEHQSTLSPLLPLPFFSQYSNRICCQHCHTIDYHFIKPFDSVYTTTRTNIDAPTDLWQPLPEPDRMLSS